MLAQVPPTMMKVTPPPSPSSPLTLIQVPALSGLAISRDSLPRPPQQRFKTDFDELEGPETFPRPPRF